MNTKTIVQKIPDVHWLCLILLCNPYRHLYLTHNNCAQGSTMTIYDIMIIIIVNYDYNHII